MSDTTLGWWFGTTDRRLGHGDGRPIVVGETHEVDPPLVLCERGLHASKHVLDALKYARGEILYRVCLAGKITRGDDKMCATRREYLAEIDATDMLWEFSRWSAAQVLHLWSAPQIVKDYLATGDESLREAASAAAWDAARAAASAAARAAASAAAWDAARDTARDAARNAAWDAQRQKLDDLAEAAIARARGGKE